MQLIFTLSEYDLKDYQVTDKKKEPVSIQTAEAM